MYDGLWNDLHGSDSEMLLEYEDRTLSSTWMISLDQVTRQDEDAAKLFKFLALFDNTELWYDLMEAGAEEGPAWLKRVTTTKIRFDRTMSKLQDYSLVETVASSYRVHPCIHDWLLERLLQTSQESESCFRMALNCVARNILDENDPRYYSSGRKLIGHVQRLRHGRFEPFWQTLYLDGGMLRMSCAFARLYGNLGEFHTAMQMYEQALHGLEKAIGPEHPITLRLVTNLGFTYFRQTKLSEAEQMYTRALAGLEKLGFHRMTVNTLHNLGVLYSNQGRVEEAEKMYTRALAGYEKIKEEMPTSDTIYYYLGIVYFLQGKLFKAEQMFTRALAGREETVGEHKTTFDVVYRLGLVYHEQGKLSEAEQTLTRAIAGYEKTLGEHRSTFDVVHNLGHVYCERGKLFEAVQMYTRAVAGFEKILGEHRSTFSAVHNLGLVYHKQGKLSEAERMYTRALTGYEKTLGEHKVTFDTVYSLGHAYYKHGKLSEAEQMFTRALAGYEKTLGEHRWTSSAVYGLGLVYHRQGKLSEAEEMFTRALAGIEKTVGLDNSLTKDVIHNLNLVRKELSRAEVGSGSGTEDEAEQAARNTEPQETPFLPDQNDAQKSHTTSLQC